MALNISKTGILTAVDFEEYIYEPDGSKWQHVFRHNNPTSNKFASSDSFSTGVYKNDDVWFNFNICNKLSSWEFIVMQQQTKNALIKKYRWSQTKNPFTAAFADVASGSITKNTSTGYTSWSTGGLYKINSSTFFCTNNGTNGNWWGAIGAWNAHQGGIPGWAGQIVTTGCIDVYVRVDSITQQANIGRLGIITSGGQFYEY